MSLVIDVQNLKVMLKTKKYKKEIVKDVSFKVHAGECVGILGESGSGKSMMVKGIMGLLDKNFVVSGCANFEGKDILKESKEGLRKLRGNRIAMVLQNPMTSFDPLYRIGNQMAETFAEHTEWKGEEIRMQSIHILKRMQILDPEEILQKYPHQVSGGTLQRIMIGIAMALKPSLLIADEPTTAIDSITQFEILQEFARIKKEYNTAMIFITHDLSAVSCIADRILVMNQGQIVDEGNLYHILNHAEDTYTRLLVEKQRAVMTSYRNAIHSKGGRICLR